MLDRAGGWRQAKAQEEDVWENATTQLAQGRAKVGQVLWRSQEGMLRIGAP